MAGKAKVTFCLMTLSICLITGISVAVLLVCSGPPPVSVYVERAMVYEEQGLFIKALGEIDTAIRKKNNLYQLHVQRGALLSKLHKYNEAQNAFIKANQIYETEFCYELLGDAYYKEGKFDDAMTAYHRAVEMYMEINFNTSGAPGFYNASQIKVYIKIINILMERKMFDEALRTIDLAIERNPGSKDLEENKNTILLEQRKRQVL